MYILIALVILLDVLRITVKQSDGLLVLIKTWKRFKKTLKKKAIKDLAGLAHFLVRLPSYHYRGAVAVDFLQKFIVFFITRVLYQAVLIRANKIFFRCLSIFIKKSTHNYPMSSSVHS